jgi:DME family drug/metabolite transporter
MSEITYRRGVLLVVLAALLWSTMGLLIRLIGDAGTWQILFWRSVGMVPVLAGFIAWRSGGHPLRAVRRAGLAGAVGGFGLVFAFAGAIYAYQETTVANAAFLFAASPLITAALAWPILKEPVRRATWVAIAVALVGIALMVREGFAAGAMAGNIAALASAFGFAAFTITLRWGRLGDMLPAVALGGTFAIVVAWIVIALNGETVRVSATDAGIAVGMGMAILGGGMVVYTIGSRAVPAADLALLTMVEVLGAPIWVWVLLGETAGPGTLMGGAVLLAALAFNALTGLRHRPPVVV